jgi:bifunctional non-homologous end joining protein LigD
MRVNLGQEFVVGGFIPSDLGVDSLVVGFYEKDQLRYAGRVRAGLIPATRRRIAKELEHLISEICPFYNLPDRGRGSWGEGITDDVMKKIIWLKPEAVAQIEFLEWTSASRLRHTRFVAMRYDKDPRMVVREI